MRKHILVISQYFYPEQFRINDICQEWVNRGYKVTVITGIPNYPNGKFYRNYGFFKRRYEIYKNIKIIRLPIIPRGNNSLLLALNYLSFVISGYFWNIFTKIKADYVFIFEVSPMSQALPGVWYAQKRKIPSYIYVQDLWPENVEIITGIKNKLIIGGIGRMVDYIYKRCTKIFTTSKSFIDSIEKRGVPREKIEYWPQYAEDFYKPLDNTNIPEISEEVFNVIFTGNIGESQGLDILPETAVIIKDKLDIDKKIVFNIVGDGRYKDVLIDKVKSSNVSEMFNFIPRKPASEIPRYLAASDVAFLSLLDSPLFNMTIPAKLQSYMACGMPIVASANGETREIIENSMSGFVCDAGDSESLAQLIIEFSNKTNDELITLGNNAREYYLKHFNKNNLLNRMDSYFEVQNNAEGQEVV